MIKVPTKPDAIMLIGLPGAGKSTWAEPYLARPNTKLISSDAFIEATAKALGKTYGDIFKSTIGAATKFMENSLNDAIQNGMNIIWDQTNLSAKSRHAKLERLLKAGYNVTAVSFELDTAELERRRLKREIETGKSIPPSVLESMGKTYVRPTRVEGFAKVIIVTPNGQFEEN